VLGTANSFVRPSPQVAQYNIVPAPIHGMNAAMNITAEDPSVCIWCVNLIPNEYGLRVREGYREWQTDLNSEEVRTMIVYYGRSIVVPTEDRIFAVTTTGIWNVTTFDGTPTQVLAFATANATSGHGVWTQYVTEAGEDLIFYADEQNGLFTYTASTDTWAQTTGITEAANSSEVFDATTIAYVVNHKLRLWLIPRQSNKAWYLPIRSIAGDAEEFFFGQKFRHGGELVGLYNWTVDGGNGRDDHLVAISRGGDVIPYTGEDPSDAMTWTTSGSFFIGPLPAKGRRIAAEHGGELFMLSTLGIITLSDLLNGGNPDDPFRNQIGYRIGRLLRQDFQDYRDDWSWEVSFMADEGLLLVTTPMRDNGDFRQYSYTLGTSGWGLWKDVPMHASAMYNGHLMIGTSDSRVLRMDVAADNILLDGSGQTEIQWAVLSSYSFLGAPGLFKRVRLVRPNFVAEREPYYALTVYYDYRMDEPPSVVGASNAEGDVWDTALWDTGLWGVSSSLPYHNALGGTGRGRAVAIALAGSSLDATFLASWDLSWDVGGFL